MNEQYWLLTVRDEYKRDKNHCLISTQVTDKSLIDYLINIDLYKDTHDTMYDNTCILFAVPITKEEFLKYQKHENRFD